MKLPSWAYKLMLLAAPLLWGASFVVMKYSLDFMGPALLVGIRFVVAGLLTLLFFARKIRENIGPRTVMAGALLGVVYFAAYWAQNVGLTDTTPGKNAFLTAAYVVMVPFLYWALARTRPGVFNVIAAVLCLAGIGFVSLDDALTMGFGDSMTLLGGFFFALHMALIPKLAADYDIFTMSFLQFIVCGALGVVVGIATEPLPDMDLLFEPVQFWQLVYLSVASSFLASLCQNVGQTHVDPSQAALILSLEGVFGVVTSVLIYGEVLSLRVIIGFVLIFAAVLVSEMLSTKELPWKKEAT